MITTRRANERHHDRRRGQEVWLTFDPVKGADGLILGFGILEILQEDHLPPGAKVARQPPHDAEILTYVREGALAYADSLGGSGVVFAGEFQRVLAPRGIRYHEANPSRTAAAQVFQIWMHPRHAILASSREHKRFGAADRRGGLCVVASPDGREGSLRLQQEVLAFSAILDSGQHIVHELQPGHSAWLHLIQGEITVGDLVFTTGDGAGITAERAVSLTARQGSEILLLDLGAASTRT